jgi:hypothetical protein
MGEVGKDLGYIASGEHWVADWPVNLA